ncbi:MAG: lipid-A-disaccharide synthase [Cyclobacteriaceae bacterium]
MKIFVVVGEQSGDSHAAAVIQKLFELEPKLSVQGWGGDAMRSAGATIHRDFRSYSAMGFWEIIKKLGQYKDLLKLCISDILAFKPDVVLLVDFGGFNLRLAKELSKSNIKISYYIPPKVWAWGDWRVHRIKRYCKQVLVTLPFEKEFFSTYDVQTSYVGNPVKEQLAHCLTLKEQEVARNYVVVIPGSRNQEVSKVLPYIKELASDQSDLHFLVSKAHAVDKEIYEQLGDIPNIELFDDDYYRHIVRAKAAIVTSGTATLEVALLKVPQVVVYKTSQLTYLIARLLTRVRHISLVNLIANRSIVTELVQNNLRLDSLSNELKEVLENQSIHKKISEGYSEIDHILGKNKASENAARLIVQLGRS